MSFRVVSILKQIIELEQLGTGHRLTFHVRDDGSDLFRGPFRENLEAGRLTKTCWRRGYLSARRAAENAGMLRPSLTEAMTIPVG